MSAIDWGHRYGGRTILGRFMSKIDRRSADGCWIWTGATTDVGYGSFRAAGRSRLAHRAMFELWHGVMPPELDHLCKITRCVNPEHLEPVSHRENMMRSDSPSARMARLTHCKYGHPFDIQNTSINSKGQRRCKTCHRDYERTHRKAR